MIYNLYSIYDSAVESYLAPMHAQTDAIIIRQLLSLMQDPQHEFRVSPKDFHVVSLGTFDTSTGTGIMTTLPNVKPILLITMSQLSDMIKDRDNQQNNPKGATNV